MCVSVRVRECVLRSQLRSEVALCISVQTDIRSVLDAVDAAVNSQYLELLTTRPEAPQGRLMFERQCVQERWEVSEDGETCTHFVTISS